MIIVIMFLVLKPNSCSALRTIEMNEFKLRTQYMSMIEVVWEVDIKKMMQYIENGYYATSIAEKQWR